MQIPAIDASLYHTRIETLRRPLSTVFAIGLCAALLFTKPIGFGEGLHEMMEAVGMLLVFAAVLGRIWCILYIGGRKNRELCRMGPYAISRNPLYFFSFVGLVGICLAAQSLLVTAVAAVVYLAYYHQVIRMEETRLGALFGTDFTAYVAQVPRFWPTWPEPLKPHRVDVDGRAFTRALSEVFWFLFALILVEGLEVLKSFHWWPDLPTPF